MIKKAIMSLLLFIAFSISLSFTSVSVFAEEIESKVTVRIIRDNTIETVSSKEKEGKSNSEKQMDAEEYKESKGRNRLPETNERIDSSISIIGLLVLLVGIVGIYINNKRNGEYKNEKY